METLLLIIFVFFIFIVFGPKSSKGSKSHGPIIHICNDGIEGHERRVAEFYGDDYDEILRERAELQRKIDSGEIERIDMTKEFFDEIDKLKKQ
jgi:hypothetical protein